MIPGRKVTDEDIDDGFSDDLLAGSDVKICDIAPKPAVAPSSKKSITPQPPVH